MRRLAVDALSSVVRFDNGATVNRMPFGFTATSGAAQLGYTGQWMEISGVYCLGHGYRAYLPTLAAFDQFDSCSPFGAGGINGYVYCKADPVNHVDPSGAILGFGINTRSLMGISLARRSASNTRIVPLNHIGRVRSYSLGSGYDSPAVTSLSQRSSFSSLGLSDGRVASSYRSSSRSGSASNRSLADSQSSELARLFRSASTDSSTGWETSSSVLMLAPSPRYPDAPPPTASPPFSPSLDSRASLSSMSSLRTPDRHGSVSPYRSPSHDGRPGSYSP